MPLPLPSLTLLPASPEQIAKSRSNTFQEWGRGVSHDKYIARDVRLDACEQAKDGKLVTWALVPVDDPNTLDFFCSCETYTRQGLYALPNTNGDPKACASFGIASVFTPPHHRKQGYASHMMRLLHWVLAPSSAAQSFPAEWGSPPPRPLELGEKLGGAISFSVLYTDVGEDFYMRCGPTPSVTGWRATSPFVTAFDITRLAFKLKMAEVEDFGYQWLDEQAALAIWDKDAGQMKRELTSTSSGSLRLCIPPTYGVAAYLNRRVTVLSPSSDTSWGISFPDGPGLAFVTWAPDPQANPPPAPVVLTITRLRVPPSLFPLALQAICIHGSRQEPKIERVEFENLSPDLIAKAQKLGLDGNEGGMVSERRKEHIPSIAIYGRDDEAEVEWIYNERYSWC